MTIAEIERDYYDCNLTAKDIADLLKCPTFSTEKVNKLAYKIYSDGEDIYYPLPSVMVHGHKYEMSLSIPREAIVKNDWSIVEDKFVFSIIKPNADSQLGKNPANWFQGKQKDKQERKSNQSQSSALNSSDEQCSFKGFPWWSSG